MPSSLASFAGSNISSAASAISKIAASASGLPIWYTSAAAVWSRQIVPIPLRSKMANARFFVTVRRVVSAKKSYRNLALRPKGTRSVTCGHFGFGWNGGGRQATTPGQLNPSVLPEVQPSNPCDGCDSKHDHQKSQQFHSSPAGAGGGPASERS